MSPDTSGSSSTYGKGHPLPSAGSCSSVRPPNTKEVAGQGRRAPFHVSKGGGSGAARPGGHGVEGCPPTLARWHVERKDKRSTDLDERWAKCQRRSIAANQVLVDRTQTRMSGPRHRATVRPGGARAAARIPRRRSSARRRYRPAGRAAASGRRPARRIGRAGVRVCAGRPSRPAQPCRPRSRFACARPFAGVRVCAGRPSRPAHAPGPQSRQRSTGGGPMRSARCISRSALRRPSSITGW